MQLEAESTNSRAVSGNQRVTSHEEQPVFSRLFLESKELIVLRHPLREKQGREEYDTQGFTLPCTPETKAGWGRLFYQTLSQRRVFISHSYSHGKAWLNRRKGQPYRTRWAHRCSGDAGCKGSRVGLLRAAHVSYTRS